MEEQTRSMGEANRLYFDKLASEYDVKPWHKKITAQVLQYLQEQTDFIGAAWVTKGDGRTARLLDYACGTGMVSKALGSHMSECKGIDVSSAMVQRYNDIAASGLLAPGIPSHAVVGNLMLPDSEIDASLRTPDMYGFDLVAVGLGFHHFADAAGSIVKLAERLKPGGVVLIIDLCDEGDFEFNAEAHSAIVAHGFSEEAMRKVFEAAGLTEVRYRVMPEPLEMRFKDKPSLKNAFLCRASKPL